MRRVAIALLLAASGCVAPPYAAYQPVPADDVARLVAGSSVLISPTGDWPFETLIYFDRAGHGWRDALLLPGTNPVPGAMAEVIAWQSTDAEGLCLWSAPLVGEIPYFVGPHRECLRVLSASAAPDTLVATITRDHRAITAPLVLQPGNAVAADRIAQYQLQVRVLSGGKIPNWGTR